MTKVRQEENENREDLESLSSTSTAVFLSLPSGFRKEKSKGIEIRLIFLPRSLFSYQDRINVWKYLGSPLGDTTQTNVLWLAFLFRDNAKIHNYLKKLIKKKKMQTWNEYQETHIIPLPVSFFIRKICICLCNLRLTVHWSLTALLHLTKDSLSLFVLLYFSSGLLRFIPSHGLLCCISSRGLNFFLGFPKINGYIS